MKYILTSLFFAFIIWIIIQADLVISNPLLSFTKKIPYGDKFGHLILYGTLVFLVNVTTNFQQIRIYNIRLLLGVFLVTSFALAEEFTQIVLASRNFEIMDIISDLVGITLFTFLSQMAYNKKLNIICVNPSK